MAFSDPSSVLLHFRTVEQELQSTIDLLYIEYGINFEQKYATALADIFSKGFFFFY
jgi:hypothetical protein